MFSNGQYYLLKGFSYLICILPYSLVVRLGRGLGHIYFIVASKQRKRGISQAMQGLAISYGEAEKVIRRLFYNLGQMFAEVMYMPRLNAEKIRKYISIEGEEYLRQAVEAGRGVVFLTAHIGNWEWMAARLSAEGFPITTIVKQQPKAQFSRFINEYREKMGVEVFSRGTNDMIKAARALKKGKVLGFLADQDGGADGVFVDFLRRKASTPLGPAVFAEKFDSVIVPGFIFRRPEGGYKIVIKSPFSYQRNADKDQGLYKNTLQMTKIIEAEIINHPEEWMWFQKRWNTQYIEGNSIIDL
ncbi:MAG: lpxL 2 [Firmicutes bacterium]|nr:lpxL 2 [Bacillota bacterium]